MSETTTSTSLADALTPAGFTPDPTRLSDALTYLKSRAIEPEAVIARGYKLVTPARAEELAAVFPMKADTIAAGTLFEAPLYAPDGTRHDLPQLRRIDADVPGWIGGKFAMPRGMTPAATLNPLAAEILADEDSTPHFIVVEGLAKADAVQGVATDSVVLAYTGVSMPSVNRGDSIGPRPGDILADDVWRFDGASVEICFDGDSATKKSVAQATDRAAALFTAAGAEVTITTIPTTEEDPGRGPDDYLADVTHFERPALWARRPRVPYSEWRAAGIKRGLLEKFRPRVVRRSQWRPEHMRGWNPATIAKLAFSIPVSTDGDAIYGEGGFKRLGTVVYDEAGRAGVSTKDTRPPEVRKALRQRGRPGKFFFDAVIPASILDQMSPATDPAHFDQIAAWLDGATPPTPPKPSGPVGARAAQEGLQEIELVSESGDVTVYRPGRGLVWIRETTDGRQVDAERVRKEELLTPWAVWSRATSRVVTLTPRGEPRQVELDETFSELVSIETNGQVYDLPNPIPFGRDSSAPSMAAIVREARGLGLSGSVLEMRDPMPGRKTEWARAYGPLSAGAATHLVSDRVEWHEGGGMVLPAGRLTADGTFDPTARADVTEPSALALRDAIPEEVTPTDSLPSERIRAWVEASFPGNLALGYSLIAAMIGAPLAGLCARIPTIWMTGAPEAGKSIAVKATRAFVYGTSIEEGGAGPSFIGATEAGIRKEMSQNGCLGMSLDDFRRSESGSLTKFQEAVALVEQIVGMRYDSQRRAQAYGAREISAWPIISAELKITETSRIHRLLFFRVEKGDVSAEALTSGGTIAADFWGWIATLANRTPLQLRDRFEELRAEYLKGREGDRLNASIGAIAAGLSLAGLADVIPMVDAEIRRQHVEEKRDAEPGQRLIDAMTGLLSSGKAHVTFREGQFATGARYLPGEAAQLYPLGWRVEPLGFEGTMSLNRRSNTELGDLSADLAHVLVPCETMQSLVAQAAGMVERGKFPKERISAALSDKVAPGSRLKSDFIPTAYVPEGRTPFRGYVIPLAALDIAAPARRAATADTGNVTPMFNPQPSASQPVQAS